MLHVITRVSSVIFEPFFYLGLISFGVCIFGKDTTKRKNAFVFILLIIFSTGWKVLFLHANGGSKRYFEILIIPWIVFAIYTFFPKGKNTNKTACLVLLAICLIGEAIKFLSIDHYPLFRIGLYRMCCKGNNHSEPANIYTNITSSEKNRIVYYCSKDHRFLLRNVESNQFLPINEVIPDYQFSRNGIFFIVEAPLNSPFQLFNTSNIDKLGRFDLIAKTFTSSKKNKVVSLYRFISNRPKENINPIFLRGSRERHFRSSSFTSSNCTITHDESGSFVVNGINSEILSRDFFEVSPLTRLDLKVDIKNIGYTNTRIYVGYAFYDQHKSLIGNSNFPYIMSNQPLTIVSAEESQYSFIVNSVPDWRKNCSVGLFAKDDLSDIPNPNLLNGFISDVKPLPDGNAEIIMTRPLKNSIPAGTQIRINHVSGSYVYTDMFDFYPQKSISILSSIAKYDTYHCHSSIAIPTGIYYLKPVILSYSSFPPEMNSIQISNFSIVY